MHEDSVVEVVGGAPSDAGHRTLEARDHRVVQLGRADTDPEAVRSERLQGRQGERLSGL
ncbi:hypothetical protein [Streptomyces sp. NPDC050546]|uniref:hypothetical protein n=1 Tax=Streptomyces sp. NPDC050546 TaxID=3365628 RepID=UPI0037B6B738